MSKTLYDVAMKRIKEYEDTSSLNPTKRGKVFQMGDINKWNEHLAQVTLHIKLDTLLQNLGAPEGEEVPAAER